MVTDSLPIFFFLLGGGTISLSCSVYDVRQTEITDHWAARQFFKQ